MKPGLSRKQKRLAALTLIVLLSVAGTVSAANTRLFQLVQLKFQDLHFLVRGRLPVEDIVLVTIDPKTLGKYKELLVFWHKYYARAMEAAARGGAKVMGLDVAFVVPVDETYHVDNDSRLAAALVATAPTMPVVIGYVPEAMQKQQEWPVPVNMIANALGLAGYANLTVDEDDFVRTQELTEEPAPGAEELGARSLAMRVAEKFRGEDARWQGRDLVWQGRTIPVLHGQRKIYINYAGPPGTVPSVSLVDLIEAADRGDWPQVERWVKGKAVLLGPDYEEDRHATPYYTLFGGSKRDETGRRVFWNTAGVEIHANTLRTLLTGQYLVPVKGWIHLLMLFAVAVSTVTIVARYQAVRGGIALALAVLVTGGVTHLFFRQGVLISTSQLLLACLLALIGTSIYRMLTAEKRGAFFQSAIQVFVGKELARSLSESEAISLSGRRQNVTILFTDIRGFTAFCESKDPAVVVDLLNEYLGEMVSRIVKYRGHVNKFIGDGILAMFTDEDEGAGPGDHPIRAVRCATEMVQVRVGSFRTGAGLHTGDAVVGNVGSRDKMEYTVLGDTVNLASRLESMNKEMKTQLILSQATYEGLKGQVETVLLGQVPVRGKTLPLNVYTVKELVASNVPEVGAAAEKH